MNLLANSRIIQLKHYLFIVSCLLCMWTPTSMAAPQLSNQAEVSLMTCDAGEDLYAAFGHSAIRVHDPVQGIDNVYNYGTFDFDTPGFYVKFMRGKLNYKMDRDPFRQFYYAYNVRNRAVVQQTLALDSTVKQQLFDKLEINYLPENRFYLYDFFFDNCSSRIRDIFVEVLGDSLVFESEFIEKEKTFRQLLDQNLTSKQWADFGIDLALGADVDQIAEPINYMFLPEYLESAFDNAFILNNGEKIPFVKQKTTIVDKPPLSKDYPFWQRPIFVFSLLFVLILLWSYFRPPNFDKLYLDKILFLIVGLAGLILFLLWFATDHSTTDNNFNILWANPIHLLSFILLFKAQKIKRLNLYFLFFAILNTAFLLLWSFLPQAMHIAFIPIMLTIILRCGVLYYYLNKKTGPSHTELLTESLRKEITK
ncbi:MAG: DUF4105 domain-containing protein [Chitinophagales bacterium]